MPHLRIKVTIDDDRYYEELKYVSDQFSTKYHMKILLEVFNAKVGREDIFNPKVRNKSLHDASNNNED
jgi:hypothetical protein